MSVWRTTSTTTFYYLTFEFTDGSREEFGVTGEEYGLLAEGDRGMVQYRELGTKVLIGFRSLTI
jgi:hypothetical protein